MPTNDSGRCEALYEQAEEAALGNFKQVVKDGDLRLHEIVARLVDKETLEKMGASAAGYGS